jgi:site-specific DNA-methyltransferase (adenine-specific)
MNELFNLDFRDHLDKMRETVVVSDPPYNIGFKYNSYDDNKTTNEYINLLSLFKNNKTILIGYPETTYQYYIPALGMPDKTIVWCYNSNIGYGHKFRLITFYHILPDLTKDFQDYKNPNDKRIKERIALGYKARLYDWWDDIQIVKNVSNEKTIHPCPIPEKLIARILKISTSESDIICDPFMGCGTVPKVAKIMNRKYLGFEIDKLYFDEAFNRLK